MSKEPAKVTDTTALAKASLGDLVSNLTLHEWQNSTRPFYIVFGFIQERTTECREVGVVHLKDKEKLLSHELPAVHSSDCRLELQSSRES